MNLTEIRTAMFAQADWSPEQSEEAVGRINGFINRAYNQLSLEAPYLFFEDKMRMAVEPDEKSASDSDTLEPLGNNDLASPGRDPWTFATTYTKTTAAADTDGLYTTTWKTDRSWDGRIIEIETGTHKVRNQIRTIWYDSSDDKYKLTLVHPFDIETHGLASGLIGSDGSTILGFKWRIYTEEYPFPDDIIKMRSMRLFNNTQQYPLDVMGQDEAEERTLVGPRAQVASGIPRVAFRREHFQLEGPGVAPTAEKALDKTIVSDQKTVPVYPWKGPEKPGEFQYVVTYTWGKRDADFRLPGLAKWDTYAQNWSNTGQTIPQAPGMEPADNRIREPRYESAPSPASSVVAVQAFEAGVKTSPYTAIKVRVPNIEYALGFLTQHPKATSPSNKRVSQHQSGIHVRIYRKRISVFPDRAEDPYASMASASKGISANKAVIDNKDKFYLLAELRVDEINQGVFIDDGQYLPDRSRPLRDIHGYQQYALYPRPDQRYEMDVRCVRRPPALDAEQDVPRIHAEAIDVLITRAMSYLYESMGNLQASQLMMGRYSELLETLSKRYGDLRPTAVPVLRRMTRARFSYRSRDNYRKWYKTNS
tara:strand:- start:125 stop:1900 length:1776 start_codon:yes stop_codon:yes gene_type:complete